MPVWDAERVVDERLAASLAGRFTETAGRPLRLLAIGWDRTVWLVDERWVFGFPRRAVVAPGIERELEWLPRLAPRLPAAIPVPHFVGEPDGVFPWPFFGSAFIPGEEAMNVDCGGRVAVDLAEFLRVLHSPQLAADIGAESLPPDGNNRADMRVRVPYTRERLLELGRLPAAAERILRDAERLQPPPKPHTIAHGDLHLRNPLVHAGRLSGVLDWIDVCRGDPSLDLMVLWSLVPQSARGDFLRAYGDVDEACLLRARVIALMLGAALALWARDQRQPQVESAALASIDRALRD